MNVFVFPTREEAERAIAEIDAALGDTEVVRTPGGNLVEVPRRTWAIPIPLKDGTWAVPHKARIADVLRGDVVAITPAERVVEED